LLRKLVEISIASDARIGEREKDDAFIQTVDPLM
jgi:hypothetical protein